MWDENLYRDDESLFASCPPEVEYEDPDTGDLEPNPEDDDR